MHLYTSFVRASSHSFPFYPSFFRWLSSGRLQSSVPLFIYIIHSILFSTLWLPHVLTTSPIILLLLFVYFSQVFCILYYNFLFYLHSPIPSLPNPSELHFPLFSFTICLCFISSYQRVLISSLQWARLLRIPFVSITHPSHDLLYLWCSRNVSFFGATPVPLCYQCKMLTYLTFVFFLLPHLAFYLLFTILHLI